MNYSLCSGDESVHIPYNQIPTVVQRLQINRINIVLIKYIGLKLQYEIEHSVNP